MIFMILAKCLLLLTAKYLTERGNCCAVRYFVFHLNNRLLDLYIYDTFPLITMSNGNAFPTSKDVENLFVSEKTMQYQFAVIRSCLFA